MTDQGVIFQCVGVVRTGRREGRTLQSDSLVFTYDINVPEEVQKKEFDRIIASYYRKYENVLNVEGMTYVINIGMELADLSSGEVSNCIISQYHKGKFTAYPFVQIKSFLDPRYCKSVPIAFTVDHWLYAL